MTHASYKALMLHAYEVCRKRIHVDPEERAKEPDEWWIKRIAHSDGLTVAFRYYEREKLVGTVELESSSNSERRITKHWWEAGTPC